MPQGHNHLYIVKVTKIQLLVQLHHRYWQMWPKRIISNPLYGTLDTLLRYIRRKKATPKEKEQQDNINWCEHSCSLLKTIAITGVAITRSSLSPISTRFNDWWMFGCKPPQYVDPDVFTWLFWTRNGWDGRRALINWPRSLKDNLNSHYRKMYNISLADLTYV